MIKKQHILLVKSFQILFVIILAIYIAKYTAGELLHYSFVILLFINVILFFFFKFRTFIMVFLTVWFFQFLFPINYINIGPAKLYPLDVLFSFVIVGYIIDVLVHRVNPFITKIDKMMGILLLTGIISIIRGVSSYGYQAIGEGRVLVFVMLYFIGRCYFRYSVDVKYIKYILFLLVSRAIYNICLGITHLLRGGGIIYTSSVEGQTYSHILGGGNTLIILLVLILITTFHRNLKKRIIVIAYTSVSLPIVFLAQVRTIYISLLAGILTYLWISKTKILSSVKVLGAGILLVLIISSFFSLPINQSVSSAVQSMFHIQTDANAQWRIAKSELEIRRVFKSGLLTSLIGLPFGSWFVWNRIGFENQGLSTHNSYVDLFTKVGFVGLFILLYILYLTSRIAFRERIYLKNLGQFYMISLSVVSVFLVSYPGLYNYNVAWFLGILVALILNFAENNPNLPDNLKKLK